MSGRPVHVVVFRPDGFSPHSGMAPLLADLGGVALEFRPTWEAWQRRSWTLGNALRQWGIRHYGWAWNALVPGWDEARFLRRLPRRAEPYPVHFIWAEFAAPRRVDPYHRRGARVVVSVHCSARRWESVWRRPDGYANADQVVLTSESQRPFVERDVPAERIRTILHGVVSRHFTPPAERKPRSGRFRMFMMGDTERDHEFAAQVAAKLPAEKFEWRIRTISHEQSVYAGLPGVTRLPRMEDEAMMEEYRQADVLAMPMLDSAANNVILESMACGTPVMINRVGGVPEYVDPGCNFVMSNDRNADEWVEKLLWLEKNRDVPEQMRPATRAWAERFDWGIMAEEYRAMYRDVGGGMTGMGGLDPMANAAGGRKTFSWRRPARRGLRWIRRRWEGVVFLALLIVLAPVLLARMGRSGRGWREIRALGARWIDYLAHGLDRLRRTYWPGIRYETAGDIWFHVFFMEWFALLNATKPSRVADGGETRRILLVKLAHFGDALHVFPMLRALRRQRSDASLDLMVGPWCESLARLFSLHDELLVYAPRLSLFERGDTKWREGLWRTLWKWHRWRQRRYDLVISTSTTSLAEALLMQVLDARCWIGTSVPSGELPQVGDLRLVPYDTRAYEADRVMGLLTLGGLETDSSELFFPVTADAREGVANLLRENGILPGVAYAVLSPGAGWPGKQWPSERFAQLGDRIRRETPWVPLLVGSADEQALCRDVSRRMERPAVSLAGQTTLSQLAALLSRAALYVGNDSGPMHVAACFHIPTVALFGPTVGSKWAPRHSAVRVLQHETCPGCVSWHYRANCSNHLKCMRAITVDEVWKAIQEVVRI